MPQNEGSFKGHECPQVARNQTWRVVSSRASCRNRSTVVEAASRSGHAFAAVHNELCRDRAFLCLGIEFDTHGVGIEIVKKNLNMKEIAFALSLNGRGAESQC